MSENKFINLYNKRFNSEQDYLVFKDYLESLGINNDVIEDIKEIQNNNYSWKDGFRIKRLNWLTYMISKDEKNYIINNDSGYFLVWIENWPGEKEYLAEIDLRGIVGELTLAVLRNEYKSYPRLTKEIPFEILKFVIIVKLWGGSK